MTQPDDKTSESHEPVKIHNVRQSKVDPFMLIHERQRKHNQRIGLIIVGSVVLATALLVFLVLWRSHTDNLQTQAVWQNINQRLDACRAEIETSQGYDKTRAILKAVNICEEALYLHARQESDKVKWHIEIVKMASLLGAEAGMPKIGNNHICAAGLIDMAYIPPGRFAMGKRGLEPGSDAELPRHDVEITQGFWMGRMEVSFAQWWHVGDRAFRVKDYQNYPLTRYDFPVCMVSWHHASTFCQHLTEQENAKGRLPEGYEYRLPTEAEWEYAARAGTTTYYSWDSDTFLPLGTTHANIWDRVAARKIDEVTRPRYVPGDGAILAWPVGRGAPNAFGLHDMLGNVQEWCFDWFAPNYRSLMGKPDPVQDLPVIVKMKQRGVYNEHLILDAAKVLRGGSWGLQPNKCRSASRDFSPPTTVNPSIGFRVVLAPKRDDRQGEKAIEITVDSAPESGIQERLNADEARLPDMRTVEPEERIQLIP